MAARVKGGGRIAGMPVGSEEPGPSADEEGDISSGPPLEAKEAEGEVSLSMRERELVIRAKQLKLSQKEKELAMERNALMEKQLEMEERSSKLHPAFRGKTESGREPQPLNEPLTEAALAAKAIAVQDREYMLQRKEEEFKKALLQAQQGDAQALNDLFSKASAMEENARVSKENLLTQVDELEGKLNTSTLARLGVAPPPTGGYGSFLPYFEPTALAQAALHSARATTEKPKMEEVKLFLGKRTEQIDKRVQNVEFNLNNLDKMEIELKKQQDKIRTNIFEVFGSVAAALEERQHALLTELDKAFDKQSKKLEEQKLKANTTHGNLIQAKQLAVVLSSGKTIDSAAIDWEKYREQFERSMQSSDPRPVWRYGFNTTLKESNFTLDADAVVNAVERRLRFNYDPGVYRRTVDDLVDVTEEAFHGVGGAFDAKAAPLTGAQFEYIMMKLAALSKAGTITPTTHRARLRELVSLAFNESRDMGKHAAQELDNVSDDNEEVVEPKEENPAIGEMDERLRRLEELILKHVTGSESQI